RGSLPAARVGLELPKLGTCQIGLDAATVNGAKGVPGLLGADLCGEFVIAPRRGFRIERRLGLGHQRDRLAAERTVNKRLLPAVRSFQHVIPDAAERDAEIKPWSGDVLQERGRKWAMD